MSDLLELASAIKAKREREGLNLRDAALASGVAFSTLSRIEKGAGPSLRVHKQIVAWLGGATPTLPLPPMDLRDWFAGQAPEPPPTWWGGGTKDCAGYALWGYQYADAMIRARAVGGEG